MGALVTGKGSEAVASPDAARTLTSREASNGAPPAERDSGPRVALALVSHPLERTPPYPTNLRPESTASGPALP